MKILFHSYWNIKELIIDCQVIDGWINKDSLSRILINLIKLIEKYSKNNTKNSYLETLKSICKSDLSFDKIKEIEYTKAPFTIDLSVNDGIEPIEKSVKGLMFLRFVRLRRFL